MAKPRKILIFIGFLLVVTIFKGPFLNVATTFAASAAPVPLVFFDTPHYKIDFQFEVSGLKGTLLLNKQIAISLPPKTLPLKVLEWNLTTLVVYTRDLWTSRIRIWTVDLIQPYFQEIVIPDRLAFNLFRQAMVYQQQVVFVFFKSARTIYKLFQSDPK